MRFDRRHRLRRVVEPAARRGRWIALALCGLAFIGAPWIGVDPYWILQLSLIAVLALIVSGLNLSYGFAGKLSSARLRCTRSVPM